MITLGDTLGEDALFDEQLIALERSTCFSETSCILQIGISDFFELNSEKSRHKGGGENLQKDFEHERKR